MSEHMFDTARLPDPDDNGYFYHPDIPGEDESDDVAAMLREMGFEFNLVCMESDAPELAEEYFEREDLSVVPKWVPTKPDGDGWVLVSKHDTEDGPYAMFVRPISSVKGGAV